jgi:hypothetical protein
LLAKVTIFATDSTRIREQKYAGLRITSSIRSGGNGPSRQGWKNGNVGVTLCDVTFQNIWGDFFYDYKENASDFGR